ncbi:MAG: hypothetical protein P4L40_09830 [Terracidiphilus sp.]|nr:hypothetical protein [Terracidiphilus sp.]
MTYEEVEKEADKMVAQSRFSGHPITRPQAIAALLEANPEAYTSFKARHDVAPVLAQLRALQALEAAGYKF